MAFIRNKGQGVMTNEPEYPVNNGMLGSANVSAKTQPTQAGQPGGWTNIQDYLGANAGDMTNQNYLTAQADKGLETAKSQMQTNLAAPTNAIPTYTPELAEQPEGRDAEIAQMEKYSVPQTYSALPTIQQPELPQANLKSIMEYIGGNIKPVNSGYNQGMQNFDELLLSGDPNFPTDFVTNRQNQYQTQVAEPYAQADEARRLEVENANKNAADWKTALEGATKPISTTPMYYNPNLDKPEIGATKDKKTGDLLNQAKIVMTPGEIAEENAIKQSKNYMDILGDYFKLDTPAKKRAEMRRPVGTKVN